MSCAVTFLPHCLVLRKEDKSVLGTYWSTGLQVLIQKSHSSRLDNLTAAAHALGYQGKYLGDCYLIDL